MKSRIIKEGENCGDGFMGDFVDWSVDILINIVCISQIQDLIK